MIWRRLLFFILLFQIGDGFIGFVKAQQNRIELINESQGLSDNRIRCFYKDSRGFIWIGTSNGLNRYDGHSFRIYSPGHKRDYLSSEFINSIAEDSKQRLWIATRGGLDILDPLDDSLIVYKPGNNSASQNDKMIPSAWIWDVDIDADGKVWLAPDARDLTCFDPTTKIFSYYPWIEFAKEKMPQRTNPYFSIRKIIPKSRNEWWLGTNVGLYSFNITSHQFTFYGGDNGGDVWVLEYDSTQGQVYFAQETGNLYRYSVNENKLNKWSPDQLQELADNPYVDASLLNGTYLPMRNYLVRFHGKEDTPEVVSMKNILENGEKFNSAGLIFTDDQDIKWIATDYGVLKFDPAVNLFHFVKVLDENSAQRVNSVFYDQVSDNYFVASPFTNSLILVNAKTNQRQEIKQIDGAPLFDCAAINESDETWLWILTRGKVFRYNRQTRVFSQFPMPFSAKKFLFIEMVKDNEGNFWFGTTDGGLFVYFVKENRWWRPTASDNFFDRDVHALCNDVKHDAVWVGTYDFGLFRYDLKRDTFAYFDSKPGDEHQLHSSLIFDLEQDQHGNIWVATNSGGLSKFSDNNSSEPFVNFDLTNGLSENTILAVQCDSKDRLWLLTYKSLTCMSDSGKTIRVYPVDPGFSYSDFGVLTTIASDGSMLIPVKNGFIHFHPDSLEPAPYSFPITIKNIFVNGNEIDWNEENEFTYPYYRNSIEVSFAALNFSQPTEINYEYKLEGADADWNYTAGLTSIKFPNLSSGRYKLLLRARDGSGALSSNAASFAFCIQPPFWKTGWFISLVIGLMGVLLYSLYRYRLKKIMELAEVRNKIAKDLHDDVGSSLSSIRIYSEMVKSQMPPSSSFAAQMLDKISFNAKESVESMSDIVWMINPKNDQLINLFDRMQQYAEEMCYASNIELTIEKDEVIKNVRLPMEARRNFYLIFKESVNNAVKYSGASSLLVALIKNDGVLTLRVNDNGNGFDLALIKKGNGLDNMKQRSQAMGGKLRIESTSGNGTTIQLEYSVS